MGQLTSVGTSECSFRTFSVAWLLTAYLASYIRRRALKTSCILSGPSTRVNVALRCISRADPMSPNKCFGVLHRGQGQPPQFRIVAHRTL